MKDRTLTGKQSVAGWYLTLCTLMAPEKTFASTQFTFTAYAMAWSS